MEDDDVKLIWCDNIVEVRRPNLILVDKKPKSCVIIDVAIPDDIEKYQFEERERERERQKERETERETETETELKRLWSLKKVEVVPVVVGALGSISKGFGGWMDTLGIKLNVGMVQKSV